MPGMASSAPGLWPPRALKSIAFMGMGGTDLCALSFHPGRHFRLHVTGSMEPSGAGTCLTDLNFLGVARAVPTWDLAQGS